ncbi:MAG: hypothetical protein ACKO97_13815, partial [Actinomycetota bacterium]
LLQLLAHPLAVVVRLVAVHDGAECIGSHTVEQNEGKKKMKAIGRVEVPGDVFISALKLDD